MFADTCHAIMAPAGEAWRKSIGLDPKLELYSSDQSHPALEGSYLTACVIYEVLFGKSVIGNTYTAGMLKYPTEFLQQVADDVVNDSLEVWNIGKFDPCKITTSEGHFKEKNTRIYPNPVKDELIISSSGEMDENSIKIRITGMTGRRYELKDLFSDKVDVSHLPAGMYFLEILSGNIKKEALKFIKQ
ncbi:MAG TPA: SGNH/GDSL hydrolase family protein [Saprospiraceae bacterium]|nr:SGNH/GDSL hydrolase family protein [Saprospiraceae bacterium]